MPRLRFDRFYCQDARTRLLRAYARELPHLLRLLAKHERAGVVRVEIVLK